MQLIPKYTDKVDSTNVNVKATFHTPVKHKDEGEISLDSSITFAKSLNLNNETSTPIKGQKDKKSTSLTPQERVNQHGLAVSTKIDNVNSSLLIIDTELKSFMTKLSEIKTATDSVIPNLKTSIPEQIFTNTKFVDLQERVENINNKIKH